LLDFLREAKLDRVGCFAYSPVEGAAANDLPDPVPEEIQLARLEKFMAVQAEISKAKLKEKIGKEYLVLIDEVTSDGAVGRTYCDAPEIDGVVYLTDQRDVEPGDRVWTRIIHSNEHDLWGVVVEEDDETEVGEEEAEE